MTTNEETSGKLTKQAKTEIDVSKGEPTYEGRYFTFAADIIETDEAVTVVADLPGVSPESLDVDLRDNVLTIMGRVEPVPHDWRLIHGEYELGGYMRQFNVGPAIEQEQIKAAVQDGVLRLLLPKAERLKPRKVQVLNG